MTAVGSVYAQALYDLAKDEGLDELILGEMEMLASVFSAEPDFLKLLGTPNLPKAERAQIIDSSFNGRVHLYVINFLKILMEKGYTRYFADCCKEYRSLYNEGHGILTVKAVTAVKLSDAQAEKLSAKLVRMTGKKIELVNVVDASCIGGVRLDYDGVRVDDTLKTRLDSIHGLLKNTVL